MPSKWKQWFISWGYALTVTHSANFSCRPSCPLRATLELLLQGFPYSSSRDDYDHMVHGGREREGEGERGRCCSNGKL